MDLLNQSTDEANAPKHFFIEIESSQMFMEIECFQK